MIVQRFKKPIPSNAVIASHFVVLREALTIRTYSRRIAPLETRVALAAARFFRKQGIAYGRLVRDAFALREAAIQPDVAQLFDGVGADIGMLALEITKCYVVGQVAASTDYALGIKFDLKNPRAVAYAKERATELLRELDQTTKDDIQQLVINAIENGTSPQVLARSIASLFVSYARKERGKQSRAERVAITEVGRAYQAGNYAAILDASGTGLEFEKQWLPVANACPICQANADQGWIAFGAAHDNGGQYPPAHPSCRCAELYRRIEAPAPVKAKSPREQRTAPTLKAPATSKTTAWKLPKLDTVAQSFTLGNVKSAQNVNKVLAQLFPGTPSNWNGSLNVAAINPYGAFRKNTGGIDLNATYIKQLRYKDIMFQTKIHELMHSRSRGMDDLRASTIGWEEAIVERNSQIHFNRIANAVGYVPTDTRGLERQWAKDTYTKLYINPLRAVVKELGLNETRYFTEALNQTIAQRQEYIRAQLIEKFGSTVGRAKYNELEKKLGTSYK